MSGEAGTTAAAKWDTPPRAGEGARVAFGLLGSVLTSVDGQPLALRSPKVRYLTAALLLHSGQAVSWSRLIEILWNDAPPVSARKNLHQYVHRLRNLLGGVGLVDRLVARPTGYVLQTYRGELDLERFEELVVAGRRARESGDLLGARASLSQALALWRDDALVDVRDSLVLDEAATVISERRMSVLEERLAVDLRLGRHRQVVPELVALVVAHPLRERLRLHQLIGLHASGRRADALIAYEQWRQTLRRELGIAPGAVVEELVAAIRQDDQAALASYLSPGTARE